MSPALRVSWLHKVTKSIGDVCRVETTDLQELYSVIHIQVQEWIKSMAVLKIETEISVETV